MSKLWVGIEGGRFVDASGRHVILRGVNLGGDCKLPYPEGGTDRPSDFANHREVSFIGRPFPIEQADEHLGRIAGWGFNVLRLLVTWEAVEHIGPGQYDRAYIDYIGAVCERAAQHGLAVFIDFHQDVWSRMTGGSGAPCWIFEKLGLDYRRFDAAGTVHVMQYRYDYASPERRQESRYPTMSWPVNYRMPVNGIMWTAFFAGATFTPQWMVDGVNVQHYLQDHYCGALSALAQRLRDLPNVIGFDSLNEPSLGWIGRRMTERPSGKVSGEFAGGLAGPAWTPLDGLRVARGLRTAVPRLAIEKGELVTTGAIDANPQGVSIWIDGAPDPFEQAGAWRSADGSAVDDHFFSRRDGKPLDPEREFMQPFFHRVAATMRVVRPDWLLFAEMSPYVVVQGRGFPAVMPERSVNASHWYDVRMLVSKQSEPAPGPAALQSTRERYRFQLGFIRLLGERMGAPSLIGEFGIPYDLDGAAAFERWAAGERDVWQSHSTALRLMYDALDQLLLSSTQWNYTASNRNDLRCGDGWNQEDLSIYSPDQRTGASDPDSGGRAVEGFCRPYVQRAQGTLRQMDYVPEQRLFTAELDTDPSIGEPTEIYLPRLFGDSFDLRVEGAGRWSFDRQRRVLQISAASAGPMRIAVQA